MIAIINKTNLSYQEVGKIIDCLNREVNTNYYGKICYTTVEIAEGEYKVTIQILKKYTKYIIEEEI